MDYYRIYDQLIKRGKTRTTPGYYEKHHIVPRCLGGNNDVENLVNLTPEEHYLAHQLLLKMYPDNTKLAHAANMMCVKRSTNKLYGWVRRRLADSMKINNPNFGGIARREYNKKYGSPNVGWIPTEEQKNKIRERQLGSNNSNADGSARKTTTYLIDAETKKVTIFDCLKDAEIDKKANHASVHYNRKRNRPYRGFYWCVGEEEYKKYKEMK